ncbi:uncharacterized protein B0H64DRAFT_367327 [Chaetomium fimeti]|uniref:Uncharacterized protein n=1 Tax=Chaetomium fimeti TaxID=1854472 RepID=A0AAE0LN33_9PEZI|nr:hypothetical protein B0H64DRAFT_367327 [Chaetomium fimeti]
MFESVGACLAFPQDPVLTRLLASSHHKAKSSETIIYDVTRGFQKSYPELLGDILRTAYLIRRALPQSMLNDQGFLNDGSSPYIGILVRSGYEFIVAFFAIRAVGGACMPMASGILPEEAHHIISKSKATLLLVGDGCTDKAASISAFVRGQGNSFEWAAIFSESSVKLDRNLISIDAEIDNSLRLSPRGPGILLFTSGTTGRPKGVVLPRSCFGFPDRVGASASGVVVSHRACHWIAGTTSLISPILSGKTLHILGENTTSEDILDALLRLHPTQICFTPTILREMKALVLSRGGPLEQYAAGFQNLSQVRCAAAPIEPSLREFWTGLTGLPFENIYGCTEAGGVICRAGSIGALLPGNELRLSEGHRGEVMVKTRGMFTHYLGDEEKTKASLDKDGFYKTGDTAELKDGEVIFTGRDTTDFIFFRYFQIPALTVEACLMELPYVADACVLGVPYHEARQLCGAVIQLRHDGTQRAVNLASIRADLAGVLPAYMLPVVLRVLGDGEQLPRTHSGKPVKKKILSELLGCTEWFPADSLPERVEYCGSWPVIDEKTARPWDLGGMQRAR